MERTTDENADKPNSVRRNAIAGYVKMGYAVCVKDDFG